MINADMKLYNYFTFGDKDAYGQEKLSDEVKGQIKIAIYVSSQSIQDNILYKDCSYIGLTQDKNIDDSYVIEYEKEKLKVLYVNSKGRFKQVFLKRMY